MGKRSVEKEKKVMDLMIHIYCKKHHHTVDCASCTELIEYAHARIDKCPFQETKTFCSTCKVHCYQTRYREQIKTIMRFSGPRMMLYHPWLAISHLIDSRRNKRVS